MIGNLLAGRYTWLSNRCEPPSISGYTRMLSRIEPGDPRTAGELLPVVYGELRRLAAAQIAGEKPGQTLDATGLVHEAYLKLAGAGSFASPSQFFRAAAQAMRRILIDLARAKKADKRGGGRRRFELAEADKMVISDPDTLLTIDEALETLALEDPTATELAHLRLYAGLSVEKAGESLGLSRATAFRNWAYARAFLSVALSGESNSANS